MKITAQIPEAYLENVKIEGLSLKPALYKCRGYTSLKNIVMYDLTLDAKEVNLRRSLEEGSLR